MNVHFYTYFMPYPPSLPRFAHWERDLFFIVEARPQPPRRTSAPTPTLRRWQRPLPRRSRFHHPGWCAARPRHYARPQLLWTLRRRPLNHSDLKVHRVDILNKSVMCTKIFIRKHILVCVKMFPDKKNCPDQGKIFMTT